MASKYEVFIPVIKMLHEQNATDKEISKCIGIDRRRVSDVRKRIGLKAIKLSEIPFRPNEIEEQLLIGGLVGDMCIFKDKRSHYHRMNFAHSRKQTNYFMIKYYLLKRFFGKPTKRSWFDKRTKNEYHEIRTQSKTNIYFSELYSKWYKNGRKIIHDDIWKINNIGLATIFFDDGYKESSGYGIALDSYSRKEIHKLKDVFQTKFDLSCTAPNHGRSIYIRKESKEHFKNIVKPLLVKGMEYKL